MKENNFYMKIFSNEGIKGGVADTTKMTIYGQIYRRECKVRGGFES